MKYIIWYKKEVTANNIKQAIDKERKMKPVFHAIEEEKEEVNQGVSAIGFEMYDPEQD